MSNVATSTTPSLLSLVNYKLFERYRTIAIITEYILHPNSHLVSGHAHHMAMMAGQVHDSSMYNSPAMKRRVIFMDISSPDRVLADPTDDFGINVGRKPLRPGGESGN